MWHQSSDYQSRSVPLTRFFDLDVLHSELSPIFAKMEKKKSLLSGSSLLALRKVHQAMYKSKRVEATGVSVPAIIKILLSMDSKSRHAKDSFFQKLQVVIVHNTMDLAAMDITRRKGCVALRSAAVAKTSGGFAASCAGCV